MARSESRLPNKTVARLSAVLSEGYSPDVEEYYLNYGTYLLLDPSHGTYV